MSLLSHLRLLRPQPARPVAAAARQTGQAAGGKRTRSLLAGIPGKAYGQRRRVATVAAGVLAVAVGYHVVFGQNGLTVYRQKRQDTRALDAQLKQLADENDALKGHVDRLAADPASIEHQAREELHYTRPGEVIITLPPDPPPAR